jgi:hypothetical protein
MELPVYAVDMLLSQPAIDWSAALAHRYGVPPAVVVNALLLYAMYDITTHAVDGMAKLHEFLRTMQACTPVPVTRVAEVGEASCSAGRVPWRGGTGA